MSGIQYARVMQELYPPGNTILIFNKSTPRRYSQKNLQTFTKQEKIKSYIHLNTTTADVYTAVVTAYSPDLRSVGRELNNIFQPSLYKGYVFTLKLDSSLLQSISVFLLITTRSPWFRFQSCTNFQHRCKESRSSKTVHWYYRTLKPTKQVIQHNCLQ